MPTPRPYGVGPYGVGPYSTYKGQIWLAGGRAKIALHEHGQAVRIYHAGAVPRLAFAARGAPRMVFGSGGGRARIGFGLVAAAQTVISRGAYSRISFTVEGIMVATWSPADSPCPGASNWITTWAA